MPIHPPWLRFQAYVVGLPKTGSTSLATMFGNYRTGHEWQLQELLGPALARQRGELTDEAFLRAVGQRLIPASLEMDSATCHHLYVEVLRDRFPQALLIHPVRDVRSWVSSLLDMVLRKRLAQRFIRLPESSWGREYFALLTGRAAAPDPDVSGDDRACLAPLMRYWAAHLREMAALLPDERSLRIRTRDLEARLPDIARCVGVPAATLRADLAHANPAPIRFDRFAAFDSDELRATYDQYCAELMADLFPEEHAAWRNRGTRGHRDQTGALRWEEYRATVEAWVAEAVQRYGPAVAR